jgi:hypothetical protein
MSNSFSQFSDSRIPYRSNLLAIAEGMILLGGLAGLDYAGIIDTQAFPVHPFLFVIMLMSAQYGIYGGIFSAIGAILIDHLDGWPVRPIDQDYFDFFLTAWADPLAWICAGLLVGVVTTRQRRALARQSTMLEAARTAESLISAQYEVLASRTRKLERSLAGLAEPKSQITHPEIDMKRNDQAPSALEIAPAKAHARSRRSNVRVDGNTP